MGEASDLPALWDAVRRADSVPARERIILLHLSFARNVAARLYARRTYPELEFSDYLQYAAIGLMEAVDRYDAGRGVAFQTFAMPRIVGAVLNGIGALSERQEQINARRYILSARWMAGKTQPPAGIDMNGQAASLHDGGDALFARLTELAIGEALGVMPDAAEARQVVEPAYPDNTFCNIEQRQLRQRIFDLLAPLPSRQRCVIRYHYLHQLCLGDIAGLLGVSKGRVSQIHKDALAALRQGIRSAAQGKVHYWFL
jgi:RNA polymerase sigma factor for flagellar operon FliA